MPHYLLDTNILIRLIRDDAIARRLKQEEGLLLTDQTPAYSVVTEGEIRAFAYKRGWGSNKLEQMDYILSYFDRVGIEHPEVIQAYALVDRYSEKIGKRIGQNDLWIAATAHATDYVLLTEDADFDHLHDVLITRVLAPRGTDAERS